MIGSLNQGFIISTFIPVGSSLQKHFVSVGMIKIQTNNSLLDSKILQD